MFLAAKLIVLSLLIAQTLKLLAIDRDVLLVCVVMSGMPVGNMPLMLGTQKGLGCSVCAAAILISTVLCVAML